MKEFLRVFFSLAIIFGVVVSQSQNALAENSQTNVLKRSVQGNIDSIDPITSKLIVKYAVVPGSKTFDQFIAQVDGHTRITKNNKTISFQDLKAGDSIAIEVTIDTQRKKTAETITVLQ